MKSVQETRSLRETAVKLVRCIGSRAALEYCYSYHWQGLYDEILALSASPDRRQ